MSNVLHILNTKTAWSGLKNLYKQPKMPDYPEPTYPSTTPPTPPAPATSVSSSDANMTTPSSDVQALVAPTPDTEDPVKLKQKQRDVATQYQAANSTLLSQAVGSRKETLS